MTGSLSDFERTRQLFQLLKENGPMSVVEICIKTNWCLDTTYKLIGVLLQKGRVHVFYKGMTEFVETADENSRR